jgi:hypothetical protein
MEPRIDPHKAICPYCGKPLKTTKLMCEYLRIDNLTGEWYKEVNYSGDIFVCSCLADKNIVGWSSTGIPIKKGESFDEKDNV